ncbi:MAG: metalloregulator ArsR/SmtB family transcription factor [Candidatus Melainabacteria bacterium]|nr:metalloregulator ArsR/SmtB family transcription factor [Candidatus Melainabacteria bacterium]
MSPQNRHASVFAALGDATRLSIVKRLSDGQPHSISELTKGTNLTRQAVTKHLRVLEDVGIVNGAKSGRENLYKFDPTPLHQARGYLDLFSAQWEQALNRLKTFVEE